MKRIIQTFIKSLLIGLSILSSAAHASAASEKTAADAKQVYETQTIQKILQFCSDPELIEQYGNVMATPAKPVDLTKKFGDKAYTLLICAVITDDQVFIDRVLLLKPAIDETDAHGNTALGYAAYTGASSITIQKLLKAGANAKHTNNQQKTVFIHASLNKQWFEQDSADLVRGYQLLFDAGVDIDAQAMDDSFAIMNAILFCNYPLIKWATERGANVLLKQFNVTPRIVAETNLATNNHAAIDLPLATKMENLTKIIALLEAQEKRNFQAMGLPWQCSIISQSAFQEMVDAHLEKLKASSPHRKENAEKVAASPSASMGDRKTAAQFHADENNPTITPLMKACRDAEQKTILDLLDSDAVVKTINNIDTHGMSALHYAILNKTVTLDVIKKLIKKGASVNVRDSNGCTPIRFAVCVDRFDIAAYLLQAGADINATDSKKLTTLFKSISLGSSEQVAWLINHNCRLIDGNNIHALAFAFSVHPHHKFLNKKALEAEKVVEIIKLLLDATFTKDCIKKRKNYHPVNLKLFSTYVAFETILPNNNDELTLPMLIASLKHEFPELMSHLLAQEVHQLGLNERNKQGKLAIDYAIARGHTELISMLKKAGSQDPREQSAAIDAAQKAIQLEQAKKEIERNDKIVKLQQKRREKEAARTVKLREQDAQAKQEIAELNAQKEALLKILAQKELEAEQKKAAQEAEAAKAAALLAAQKAASPSPDPRMSPHSELVSPETIEITIKPGTPAPAEAAGAALAPAQMPPTVPLKVVIKSKGKEDVEAHVDPNGATTLTVKVVKKKSSATADKHQSKMEEEAQKKTNADPNSIEALTGYLKPDKKTHAATIEKLLKDTKRKLEADFYRLDQNDLDACLEFYTKEINGDLSARKSQEIVGYKNIYKIVKIALEQGAHLSTKLQSQCEEEIKRAKFMRRVVADQIEHAAKKLQQPTAIATQAV